MASTKVFHNNLDTPVTKFHDEYDTKRGSLSSESSSSSSSGSSEDEVVCVKIGQSNAVNNTTENKERYIDLNDLLGQPSDSFNDTTYYEIEVCNDTVYWTTQDGTYDETPLDKWSKKPVTSERIELNCSVFGQKTDHLMPSTSSTTYTEEYRQLYSSLQGSLGLHVDKDGNPTDEAEIGEHVAFLSLGCKSFPRSLIGKTLKAWMTNPALLEEVSVSWAETLENRRDVVTEMNREFLSYRMKHIWSLSKHFSSPFARARIPDYVNKHSKENKDLVDMYVLYTEDGERMAVLSVSDVALTLHCGFKHGPDTVPALKQAFAHVTQIEHDYYEIDEGVLPRFQQG